MPAPHPLASLAAGGDVGRSLAVAQLRALLEAHGLDVRATAAALVPPVHDTTLHDWIVRLDLRAWLDAERARSLGVSRGPEKSTGRRKKVVAKSSDAR